MFCDQTCFLYKKATVFCGGKKLSLSFCHSCFRCWLLLGLREKIILSTSIKFPFHCIFHCERLAVYDQLYNGMYREINIPMFWVEKPRETTLSDTYSHFSMSWNGWWSITANNGGEINQWARCTNPASRDEMNWSHSQTQYISQRGRFNIRGGDKGISVKHLQSGSAASQTATYQRTDEETTCSRALRHSRPKPSFWWFLQCSSSHSRRVLTNHFRDCLYMYLADTFIQKRNKSS